MKMMLLYAVMSIHSMLVSPITVHVLSTLYVKNVLAVFGNLLLLSCRD